jgi:phospholipase C
MFGVLSLAWWRRIVSTAVSTALLASCGGQRAASTPVPSLPAAAGSRAVGGEVRGSISQGKIQHVLFVIQENRSFDNLFQGYPGADTRSKGLDSNGNWVKLTPISMSAPYDIDHSSTAFFEAYDSGKLDGWDKEQNGADPSEYPNPQYGYVPHHESQLYFEMANQYVLADHMFTSHIDASYISHQYAIAAQANGAVDFPSSVWGCYDPQDTIATLMNNRQYGPREPVCQNYQTLGDELDAVGLSWRYYAFSKRSLWIAYRSIRHIVHGPDWKTDIVGSSARVLSDIKHGNLANVVWVTPTGVNSDHGGSLSTTGPQWVASIVDAVGESPYWNSSAIFVMWDEWGGWYDHVKPRYEDYDGLGFRVPLLVISPYAKQGYVTHVQYEHGSVLRFIEDNFGLSVLAASDARANDPANDAFDFSKPPRAFVPFKTKFTADDFLRMEQSGPQLEPDTQ